MNTFILILDIFRVFVYVAILYESVTLCNLYIMAYQNMKKSPIIGALAFMFGCIAGHFTLITSAPIVKYINSDWYSWMLALSILPMVAFWYAIRTFRLRSLDNEVKKICKKK